MAHFSITYRQLRRVGFNVLLDIL